MGATPPWPRFCFHPARSFGISRVGPCIHYKLALGGELLIVPQGLNGVSCTLGYRALTAACPRSHSVELPESFNLRFSQFAVKMSSMRETVPERSLAAEFAISVLWFLGAVPIALAFCFLS